MRPKTTKSAPAKRVTKRDEMLAELRIVGGQLANAVFNMSQRVEYVAHDRRVLGETVRRWDATLAKAMGAKVFNV
jgi:hypothetical protein